MVRKKLLQLATCGLIALTVSVSDYNTEKPLNCRDYIAIRGFSYLDDDMRYAIPIITPKALPTDINVVNTGRCIQKYMQDEQYELIEFESQYMNEIDILEMMNW